VRAIAEGLNPRPTLLILYPRHLDDVFDDHARVGFAVGRLERARDLVDKMQNVFQSVEESVEGARRPHVAFLQWVDPLFCAGYWVPQLIEIAGGKDLLNRAGLSPGRVHWADLRKQNPDVLIVASEDMDVERVREEMPLLTDRTVWHEIAAVRHHRVYIGAGPYFTRAGPRLVAGIRALGWAIHPDRFPEPPPEVLRKFEY
jgi:iron complex transport system substrate-binding protein